tara:strand:- start:2799 stop:3104 length:306 start_codon:yes stop_codon:yes gene_type:complete
MAPTTAIEDIDAIAGIIILIVPAAAKADIGKAIAGIARIIIVKRRIRIALIASIVDIAVTIIAGAAIHAAAQPQKRADCYDRFQGSGYLKLDHDFSHRNRP